MYGRITIYGSFQLETEHYKKTKKESIMIIFNSDLDNTLIYSYKRDIGEKKKCVEIYEGREISFMTDNSVSLLKQVVEKVVFVPTTTRTTEQYERITFATGVPRFALTCNGGVLLVDGKREENWYQESRELVRGYRRELESAVTLLEADENRSMEVRFIEELFVFTKSEKPDLTIAKLKERLDTGLVDVLENGVKVYVVPKNLTKGMAVERLRKRLKPECVIAAGDSEFDVSMLACADLAVVPEKLAKEYFIRKDKVVIDGRKIYADGLLEYLLSYIER